MTYTLNKWTFFIILFFFSLVYGKWERYALIAHAVREGELGRLGRSKNLKNP